VAKRKYRSRSNMSESMLKKPNATEPWLRESKARGMIYLLFE
jgi:hypothetical protein